MTKQEFFQEINKVAQMMQSTFEMQTTFSGELLLPNGQTKYVDLAAQYQGFVERGLPDNEAVSFLLDNVSGMIKEPSYNFEQFKKELQEVFQKNGTMELDCNMHSNGRPHALVVNKRGDVLGDFSLEAAYDEFRKKACITREHPQFNFEFFVRDKLKTIGYDEISKNFRKSYDAPRRDSTEVEPLKTLKVDVMAAETEAAMVDHIAKAVEKEQIPVPEGFSCPFAKDTESVLSALRACETSLHSLSSQNTDLKAQMENLTKQVAELTSQIAGLTRQTKEAGDTVIAIGKTNTSPFFAAAGKMLSSFRDFTKEIKENVSEKFKGIKDAFRWEKTLSDDENLLDGIIKDADASDKMQFNQDKLVSFEFLSNACAGIKKALIDTPKDSAAKLYENITNGIQNSRYNHALRRLDSVSKREKSSSGALETLRRCDRAVFAAKMAFVEAFNIAKGTSFIQREYEESAFCKAAAEPYAKKVQELNEKKDEILQQVEKLMPEKVREAREKAKADYDFLNNVEPITKD